MSAITTHILDLSSGKPAAGVTVRLEHLNGDAAHLLAEKQTDADGRIRDLLPDPHQLTPGPYRLRFLTAAYFKSRHQYSFFPFVEITFEITDPLVHHHVPLLISPFGYSTYRGS
jgi:5-hydroxyisourate hydrolase